MAPTHAEALRSLAPAWPVAARHAVALGVSAGARSALLARRDLTVSHTQKVTLGIIGAYVVVIALLWNLPYVRWVLWPFKVSETSQTSPQGGLTPHHFFLAPII